MINANVVFATFVILIAFIGASRGWVREVILTFSMIFALFVLSFFKGQIDDVVARWTPESKWLARAVPFLFIAVVGYASPALARNKVGGSSGRVEEGALAAMIGAFNGYVIFSSLAYFAYDVGIMKGAEYRWSPTNVLFQAPQGGWDQFWFITNSAVLYFSGSTLVLVMIALVLFVLVVVI